MATMQDPTSRHSSRAFAMAARLSLALVALTLSAAELPAARHELDPITVTARRLADEQLGMDVEHGLAADRMAMADHVTVRVHNGVVTLSGLVFDDWDMRTVMRAARRIPGVRRVVNDLEIEQGGD